MAWEIDISRPKSQFDESNLKEITNKPNQLEAARAALLLSKILECWVILRTFSGLNFFAPRAAAISWEIGEFYSPSLSGSRYALIVRQSYKLNIMAENTTFREKKIVTQSELISYLANQVLICKKVIQFSIPNRMPDCYDWIVSVIKIKV